MPINRGKQFEQKFKEDFLRTVPNCSLDRIYDSVSGYKAVSNISDYIGYSYPLIFYIECKSHKGASLPIANITQYEKLKSKVGIHGVRAGVVLWLTEKDLVCYIPISTITKLKEAGKKSVGLKAIEEGYNIKIIPSEKKRVFLDSDYSCLLQLEDGE